MRRPAEWVATVRVPDGVYRGRCLDEVMADGDFARLRYYARRRRGRLAAASLELLDWLGESIDLALDDELRLRAVAAAERR